MKTWNEIYYQRSLVHDNFGSDQVMIFKPTTRMKEERIEDKIVIVLIERQHNTTFQWSGRVMLLASSNAEGNFAS